MSIGVEAMKRLDRANVTVFDLQVMTMDMFSLKFNKSKNMKFPVEHRITILLLTPAVCL